jgi:monovalent cation:H+ antiporter-2, CPA2 family
VKVVSVRRANGAVTKPDLALVLGAGDTLVLSGLPEALARAEVRLLGRKKPQGPAARAT